MVLRRRNPDMPRPFRTPWVPLIPVLGILVNLLLMFGLGLSNWARLLGWLALGLLIYFGRRRARSGSAELARDSA